MIRPQFILEKGKVMVSGQVMKLAFECKAPQ